MKFLLAALALSLGTVAAAQISPPGLGRANNAFWSAVALRQDLDSAEVWQSVSYIGHGRKSNPSDRDLFSKNVIWVLNQEFYKSLRNSWRISFALSYRHQSQFDEADGQYFIAMPAYENEFRYYSRLSKSWKFGRWKIAPTLRQEIRRFYEPGFKEGNERLQFRTRLRLQATYYLSANKVHRIVGGVESLFSGSIYGVKPAGSGFNYRETRLTLYYSIDPQQFPVTFDIGYMNDLIGGPNATSVHYFCVDLIYDDLFPLKSRRKKPVLDNME